MRRRLDIPNSKQRTSSFFIVLMNARVSKVTFVKRENKIKFIKRAVYGEVDKHVEKKLLYSFCERRAMKVRVY